MRKLVLSFVSALLLAACIPTTPTPQIIYLPAPTKPEEQLCVERFPECHPWDTVSQYNGMYTCFIGRAERVLFVKDELSDMHTWQVFFDPRAFMMPENRADIIDSDIAGQIFAQTSGLVLIMVPGSLGTPSERDCVAVYGNVWGSRVMSDFKGDPFNPMISITKCACGN